MSYQVGWLEHFRPEDATFETLQQAILQAVTMSGDDELQNHCGAEMAVGIWTGQGQGSKIVLIVYEGKVFKPTEEPTP